MPRGVWSAKNERQYAAIKASCESRGRASKTCARMAAATVNKARAKKRKTRLGAIEPRRFACTFSVSYPGGRQDHRTIEAALNAAQELATAHHREMRVQLVCLDDLVRPSPWGGVRHEVALCSTTDCRLVKPKSRS